MVILDAPLHPGDAIGLRERAKGQTRQQLNQVDFAEFAEPRPSILIC